MKNQSELNKTIVQKFNKECIEIANKSSFDQLLSEQVINHSAPPNAPNGKASFDFFINNILHKGFSDLKVEILDQIAEGDLVATRKKIKGKHTGEIFGIVASQKEVEINIIDIIRLNNGQYVEHWGQSNFTDVLNEISKP